MVSQAHLALGSKDKSWLISTLFTILASILRIPVLKINILSMVFENRERKVFEILEDLL